MVEPPGRRPKKEIIGRVIVRYVESGGRENYTKVEVSVGGCRDRKQRG